MKTRFLIVPLMLLTGIVFAQAGPSSPPFLADLADELAGSGWSEGEIVAILDAAGDLDWSGVEDADAEIAALALTYLHRERTASLSPEDVARLALQVALATRAMVGVGFDRVDIARSVMEGTRAGQLASDSSSETGTGKQLAMQVRVQVRESVRRALRSAAAEDLPRETADAVRRMEGPAEIPIPGGGPGNQPADSQR